MRIAFYGNFMPEHPNPYSSEHHYSKTLQDLGHQVVELQETTATTDQVLAESLKSDMLVWVHSHGFVNKGSISMLHVLEELKAKKIPTVAYHLDLYMGLERWKEYENSDYFKVEYFFTVDKLMADWLNENTNTNGRFMMAGVYKPECYMVDPAGRPRDVIFVGSKGYHPEWPYRPKLIEYLNGIYWQHFTHVGGDGQIKTTRGHELNKLYANSKVTVGDSLNIGFDYPWYSSDRIFESLGRGAFLIYPRIKGIDEVLIDRKHVVYYEHGNLVDLREKIDYYLNNKMEAEKIRVEGHLYVKENHTYHNRWQAILKEVYNV